MISAFHTNSAESSLNRIVLLAFFLILSAFVLWPANPSLHTIPYRDSSVFLYIGKRILEGELPYINVWDHKPPLVFFINALGLAITNGSIWGVWLIEVISLTYTTFLAHFLLTRIFGFLSSTIAVVTGILSLSFVLQMGNLTEEYALPFQCIAIYGFLRMENSQDNKWKSLWTGLALGVAFMLKQNLIGVWLAIGIYLLLRAIFSRKIKALVELGIILLGGGLLVLLVAGFFIYFGSFDEFLKAIFSYNFAYSDISNTSRLSGLIEIINFALLKSPYFIFVFLSWILIVFLLFFYDRDMLNTVRQHRTGRMFLILALMGSIVFLVLWWKTSFFADWPIWFTYLIGLLPFLGFILAAGYYTGFWERFIFKRLSNLSNHNLGELNLPALRYSAILLPIEFALISFSGRSFPHYIIVMFPALILISAIGVRCLLVVVQKLNLRFYPVLVLSLCILLGGYGYAEVIRLSHPTHDVQHELAIEFVRNHTTAGETVLSWGAETVVNLMSDRPAPTRFIYQYPLYMRGFTELTLFEELLTDLEENPPKIIIDTVNGCTPFMDQQSTALCPYSVYEKNPKGLNLIIDFVRANYRIIEKDLGDQKWVVYEYQSGIEQSAPIKLK